jgi:sterol desaturase/sphingolipid hydroxylase (fatty acid hydroxylase superfamily)
LPCGHGYLVDAASPGEKLSAKSFAGVLIPPQCVCRHALVHADSVKIHNGTLDAPSGQQREECCMPNRILIWTLAAIAVVLVAVPVLGVFGMMGVGWATGDFLTSGVSVGANIAGAVSFVMGVLIVVTLLMVLVEDTTHA